MCDEHTDREDAEWLVSRGLSRRSFGALGAGAVAIATLPGCMSTPTAEATAGTPSPTAERMVSVATPDGAIDALFVHPAKGRHPAIVMWPDVAGLRDAYKTMARRLAAAGFAVLAVNQYYRAGPAPFVATMGEWRTPDGQAKLAPAIATLSPENTRRDAAALVGWLDRQAAVDTRRKIGMAGYCQTGSFTLRSAAALPQRIGAAASFHGGGLVTDKPDSPHLLFPGMSATVLIAIAQNDDARDPAAKTALRNAADQAGRKAEIEVYPAQHGWCTLDSPVYDEPQAERAWNRMLALFAGL